MMKEKYKGYWLGKKQPREMVQKRASKLIGKRHTEEAKKKIALSHLCHKNGMWKGDKVGLIALHEWIRRRLPQPDYCERCNKKIKKLDLTNISQKYKRRLDDWEYLCRSCHMNVDGRLLKLHEGNKKNGGKNG